ncbi:MAG TPA: DUF4872 domain-containing protein, partial [Thermomicrobiales bacterium]|nr:DUF4872 domain-containing protein [Thermomicrobiales bacterium]
FEGTPPAMALGARHEWQHSPGLFIPRICERIGVATTVRETSGRKSAATQLRDALTSGKPAAVAADMASVPHTMLPEHLVKYMYHLIVVCGLDEASGTVTVDDRARTPFTMTLAQLADARQAITSMKHRLVTIEPGGEFDLAAAIGAGIHACADGLLNPPIRNFGAAAWEKWAGLIANSKDKKGWPNVFTPGPNLYSGLRGIYQSVEAGGNGSGMMRGMYADFLDEAATAAQRPELSEHAAAWRGVAGRWTDLANAALPDSAPPLAEARELLHRREQVFLERGADGLDELRTVDGRLTEIQAAMATDFPLDQAQSQALLNDLRGRLLEIYAAEVAAATALAG